jgi:hypothetical protein
MDYSWYKGTDLGENIVKLHEISQTFSNFWNKDNVGDKVIDLEISLDD